MVGFQCFMIFITVLPYLEFHPIIILKTLTLKPSWSTSTVFYIAVMHTLPQTELLYVARHFVLVIVSFAGLDLGDEVTDKPLKDLGLSLSGPQHFVVVCSFITVVICHYLVGDEGQSQDTQATVSRHHHLWDSAHT